MAERTRVCIKLSIIPFNETSHFKEFFDQYIASTVPSKRNFKDTVKWITKRHLRYVVESINDFDSRFSARVHGGLVELSSDDWRMDLRTLMGSSVMEEVENIEIVR